MRSLRLILVVAMTLLAALAIPMQASAQSTSSDLGEVSPTFVGPAATGCASAGCALLTGPFPTPSVASLSSKEAAVAKPLTESAIQSRPHVMPWHNRPLPPRVPFLARVLPTVSCEPLGAGCDTIS